MGRRPTPKTKRDEPPKLDPDNIGLDHPNLENDLPPEPIIDDREEFSDLFDDTEPNLKVELYRHSPVSYNGQNIAGYVCDLMPGTDKQSIKNQYGGGKYLIKKRIDGQLFGQRSLLISGPPKLESPPQPGNPAGPLIAPGLNNQTVIDGIPVSGTDADFAKTLERIATIRAMFPPPAPPVDINATLLAHFLSSSNSQTKLGDQIETINALSELGERLASKGGDGPSDFMSIAGKAIDTFGKLIEARSGAGRPVPGTYHAPRPLPASGAAILQPKQVTGPGLEPENEIKPAPETINQESETVNIKQLAGYAITNIVASYVSDPPLSVDEAVEILNFNMEGITPDIKNQIDGFKGVLKNMATLQYNDQFDQAPGPEDRKRFLLFFDEVFIKFLSVA